MHEIPAKPSLDGLEVRWDAQWERSGVYRFERDAERAQVYSIDTPPPTVSGSLHLGTVFGYVQTDVLARFHRMRGKHVFYPMGWDDNGLPTERRVQNHYAVRCEPTLPYDPDLKIGEAPPPARGKRVEQQPISRRNFVELCQELTGRDEQAFEQLWRMVGLSVDWTLTYATIDENARRVAQRAFLDNLERGEAYSAEAPTLWDVDFRTAVAQAELEDRDVASAYHRLRFASPSGGIEIETTRPELVPACVALVAHPDDERYQPLFGTTVRTPVFGVEVPVLAHPKAEPEKGTGIAMVCTFGDTTDVIWWRELGLPVRSVIRRDGRFTTETPPWLDNAETWQQLAGKTANQARAAFLELARDDGSLIGDPKPIVHPVKFYEKGDRPLEIVTSRQWYIRNGATDGTLREQMLARGRELDWHPAHMRVRYEHWIEGLNIDWLISRQRFFGVAFPLWYPLDADGEPDLDAPIAPQHLPVDPQSETPPGYEEHQRGKPGGFIGDPDVMDTWATSSLTPQIVCGWGRDEDLFARTFPMDLRPQGPEIIRTWLFATALRSQLAHDELPWAHTSINGWILDPDRKKMSKSKGNVTTPIALLKEFGADGLRYWAAGAAPGTDTAADPAVMKVGRRLANKVLNASRFVAGVTEHSPHTGDEHGEHKRLLHRQKKQIITAPVDRAAIATLAEVVATATDALDGYRYHRALEAVEGFFWTFCDDYLELVKSRAYDERELPKEHRSAQWTLHLCIDVLLRLLAPFLPFVTEEVWSWRHHDSNGYDSIHRAEWPDADALRDLASGVDPAVLTAATAVLAEIRKAKSTQSRSLKTPVTRLVIRGADARLRDVADDLRAASSASSDIEWVDGAPGVDVELAEPVPAD